MKRYYSIFFVSVALACVSFVMGLSANSKRQLLLGNVCALSDDEKPTATHRKSHKISTSCNGLTYHFSSTIGYYSSDGKKFGSEIAGELSSGKLLKTVYADGGITGKANYIWNGNYGGSQGINLNVTFEPELASPTDMELCDGPYDEKVDCYKNDPCSSYINSMLSVILSSYGLKLVDIN